MTLEQTILEKVRSLSPDKQQKILDFAESLGNLRFSTKRQWSSNSEYVWCLGR